MMEESFSHQMQDHLDVNSMPLHSSYIVFVARILLSYIWASDGVHHPSQCQHISGRMSLLQEISDP